MSDDIFDTEWARGERKGFTRADLANAIGPMWGIPPDEIGVVVAVVVRKDGRMRTGGNMRHAGDIVQVLTGAVEELMTSAAVEHAIESVPIPDDVSGLSP